MVQDTVPTLTLLDPVVVQLPPLLAQYHSFYPLESQRQIGAVSKAFGVPTAVYKCQSIHDGLPYVLRKVDVNLRTNFDTALKTAEPWKNTQHSGMVTLRDVFRSGGIAMLLFTDLKRAYSLLMTTSLRRKL